MRDDNYDFIVKLIKETHLDSISAIELVEYIVNVGDIYVAMQIYDDFGIDVLIIYKRGLKL